MHVAWFIAAFQYSEVAVDEIDEYVRCGELPSVSDSSCDNIPYDPGVMDGLINRKQIPAGWIGG